MDFLRSFIMSDTCFDFPVLLWYVFCLVIRNILWLSMILYLDFGLYLYLLRIVHRSCDLCLQLDNVGVMMGYHWKVSGIYWVYDLGWDAQYVESLLKRCDGFFVIIEYDGFCFSATSAAIWSHWFVFTFIVNGLGKSLIEFILLEINISLNWGLSRLWDEVSGTW